MKMTHLILVFIFFLFLMSCVGSKYSVKKFAELSDITYLDGSYKNRFYEQSDSLYSLTNGRLSSIFDIYVDSIDYIKLKFDKKM